MYIMYTTMFIICIYSYVLSFFVIDINLELIKLLFIEKLVNAGTRESNLVR